MTSLQRARSQPAIFAPKSVRPLRDGLVAATAVSRSVRKEPVDDQAADGEEEDEQAPEDLVQHGAVRLEDLDCRADASALFCTAWDAVLASSAVLESAKTRRLGWFRTY